MSGNQILILIAIICELGAVFPWPPSERVNLMALGLVFFLISLLVH